MDARQFLGLEPSHNPYRWHLPVTPGLSTGAASSSAGAASAPRSPRSRARPGARWCGPPRSTSATRSHRPWSTSTCTWRSAGARAARPRGRPRRRPGDLHGQRRPRLAAARHRRHLRHAARRACARGLRPPPAAYPGRGVDHEPPRAAPGQRSGVGGPEGSPAVGGRSALWARIPDLLEPSAATLAILGDYVPFGIGQALGAFAGGNSLDNTLRVRRIVPTEWILLDIQVDGIASGFGHGTVHLFAQDGTLMASASQSTIVRFWEPERPGTRAQEEHS
ncbi:MAG: thioesterase family protein [Acidimicrobiales bacterium]